MLGPHDLIIDYYSDVNCILGSYDCTVLVVHNKRFTARNSGVPSRMWPMLSKESDFAVWKAQFESATKAKLFQKFTEDENANKKLLEDFRLSLLPSVLSEEILQGCLEKFSLGTTTYRTGLESVKEHWIRVTRPSDISHELSSIVICSSDDVMPAWKKFLQLRYYSNFSDEFVTHHLINSISDQTVKNTVQSHCFGKELSPKEVVDFLLSLSFNSVPTRSAIAAVNVRCFNCEKVGHISRNCRAQRSLCSLCKRRGHMDVFCKLAKN